MKTLQEEFFLLLQGFNEAEILNKFIVIGSWAKEIYMENFPIRRSTIKTLDIDFTIINPKGLYNKSVNDLLKEYEYKPELTIFSKSVTYFPASESKKLKIDFLSPYTRKITEPTNISGLNIVVTPLTYQDILVKNIIELPYRGLKIKVPDPAIWAIHKIAISQLREGDRLRRIAKEKSDLAGAKDVLEYFGAEKLDTIAEERFRGKFLNFYKEGMKKIKSKDINLENDFDHGMEF